MRCVGDRLAVWDACGGVGWRSLDLLLGEADQLCLVSSEVGEDVGDEVFVEAMGFGGWCPGCWEWEILGGCGVEFVDGPLFEGLVVGFGGLAVGSEGGEIDFDAEDLGYGVELLFAAGFGGCVVGHESGNDGEE